MFTTENFKVNLIAPNSELIKKAHDEAKAKLDTSLKAYLIIKKPELKKLREEFDSAFDSNQVQTMVSVLKPGNDKAPAEKKHDLEKLNMSELKGILSAKIRQVNTTLELYMSLSDCIDKGETFDLKPYEQFEKATGSKEAKEFSTGLINYKSACNNLISIKSESDNYTANINLIDNATEFDKFVLMAIIEKAKLINATDHSVVVTEYRKRIGKKISSVVSTGDKESRADEYKIYSPDGAVYLGDTFPESIRQMAIAIGCTGTIMTGTTPQDINKPWRNWGIGWVQGASFAHSLLKTTLGEEIAKTWLFTPLGGGDAKVAYNKLKG